MRDVINILITSKYEEDPIKIEGARVATRPTRALHNGADWQDYGAKKNYDGATKSMNGANVPVFFHRSMGLILQVSLYFLADKNTKHI